MTQLVQADLAEAELVHLIRDAIAAGVVLDTWMNGEQEEVIAPEALTWLAGAEVARIAPAIAAGPPPVLSFSEGLVAVHEIIMGTALYHAQLTKGRRELDQAEVARAVDRVEAFVGRQPLGWVALRIVYLIISAHEDLNALAYYGAMDQHDFLMGTLHRPWSDGVFSDQLAHYRRFGFVEIQYRGQGDTVIITPAGQSLLARLRFLLEASGELAWRADAQRWSIFGELDFDTVHPRVFPDAAHPTMEFLRRCEIRPGMQVLEVGCGTGRATIDCGLFQDVGNSGRLVALDPSRALLDRLEAKRQTAGIRYIEVVQGRAEHLPFADDTFDACLAVAALHFTELEQAVFEMARVTKPGGLVAAICPPPQTDLRIIPMVALWFRPLADVAEQWDIPFGERTGLPTGALETTFRRHLTAVAYTTMPSTMSAADPGAFLAFVLKGGAFYQNLLCRVPYAERWALIGRLERTGHALVLQTTRTEQTAVLHHEAVFGRVPWTT